MITGLLGLSIWIKFVFTYRMQITHLKNDTCLYVFRRRTSMICLTRNFGSRTKSLLHDSIMIACSIGFLPRHEGTKFKYQSDTKIKYQSKIEKKRHKVSDKPDHHLTMNKTEIGEENLYYEMESKQANDAGIYDDVASESTAPATKQTIWRKQRNEKKRPASTEPAHSCQTNQILIDQRLLCIITVVVAVSFLTAAATFILALTMMTSRNSSTAASDCATVQGKLTFWGQTETASN